MDMPVRPTDMFTHRILKIGRRVKLLVSYLSHVIYFVKVRRNLKTKLMICELIKTYMNIEQKTISNPSGLKLKL